MQFVRAWLDGWFGAATAESDRHSADAPFSFTCGARSSREWLKLADAHRTTGDGAGNRRLHQLRWRDAATGLACVMELTEFHDFPAMEWVVRVRNDGSAETDAIANSVVEAGTNAIQHGHHYDARLPVDMIFEVRGDRLCVRVHDVGPGFDVAKVLSADPTSPESILAPRGRGIFIMKSLMDEVEFVMSPGSGTTAVLTKYHRAAR